MATATRQRLLDAAFELFSMHGFHAVGLDRVLADAGVSKQTFYNHFESRDHLILEVIRTRDEFEMKSFQAALCEYGGEDPAKQLEVLFDVLDLHFKHNGARGCIFLITAAEFPLPHDPIHQAAARHIQAVQDLIRRLAVQANAKDADMLAEQFTVLIEGAVLLRQATGNEQAAAIAAQTAKLILAHQLPAQSRDSKPTLPAAHSSQRTKASIA